MCCITQSFVVLINESDTTHQVLAQGNFVLAVRGGIFGDKPTAYYDFGE